MKEHPILFSGPLVRAILDGRKTQTRRIIRPPRGEGWVPWAILQDPLRFSWERKENLMRKTHDQICPYGQPGDRLWVREASRWSGSLDGGDCEVEYRADGAKLRRTVVGESGYSSTRDWKLWTPSIHMPRWASRIDLEVTEVRVQRIQEISDADILAEGILEEPLNDPRSGAYRGQFQVAWEQIYRGTWAGNAWVWAVSFKRVQG